MHHVSIKATMIPQNLKLLQSQMREVMRLYPDASDKELYYRAIDRYYVPQGKWPVGMLSADTIPSMDSLLRRVREIREELRSQKRHQKLW